MLLLQFFLVTSTPSYQIKGPFMSFEILADLTRAHLSIPPTASTLPRMQVPFPCLAVILSNKIPFNLRPYLFLFVTSKQHRAQEGKGSTQWSHSWAACSACQYGDSQSLDTARSETVNRTGHQKSPSNIKNSTFFQFTVQFYGIEVVLK